MTPLLPNRDATEVGDDDTTFSLTLLDLTLIVLNHFVKSL